MASAEFDLGRELDRLEPLHRSAFAAACCERLLPAFEAFSNEEGWGDPAVLRKATDRVWQSLLSGGLDAKEAVLLAKLCEEQVVHLDDPFGSDFAAPAQNSALAVLRTVECAVRGDAELATRVGEFALDAFEAYVDATEGVGATYDRSLVESHPLVRGELQAQREAVRLLGNSRELDQRTLDSLRRPVVWPV